MTVKGRSINGVFAVSIIGLSLVVALSVANASAIHSQLDDWKLLPRPERLTELYFTDHTRLPATYTPGAAQTVAFTVHNVEYRAMDYGYTITQSTADGAQSQQIASGNLALADNQAQSATVPVTPLDLGQRSKITVQLSSGETISYYVSEIQS